MSKVRVEAGLLSEEGGQAVPVNHFKGAAFGNVNAPGLAGPVLLFDFNLHASQPWCCRGSIRG